MLLPQASQGLVRSTIAVFKVSTSFKSRLETTFLSSGEVSEREA
jgi:hypothetical protein